MKKQYYRVNPDLLRIERVAEMDIMPNSFKDFYEARQALLDILENKAWHYGVLAQDLRMVSEKEYFIWN